MLIIQSFSAFKVGKVSTFMVFGKIKYSKIYHIIAD